MSTGIKALRDALDILDREGTESALILRELNDFLGKRKSRIIARFISGEKRKDIAKSLGVSYGRVTAIIDKAFKDGDILYYTVRDY